MSDPVEKAVQRAWDNLPTGYYFSREDVMAAAVREALTPIKEKWVELEKIHRGRTAEEGWEILKEFSILIFNDEELEKIVNELSSD